eukprot:TRINITY_DN4082_c1_g1_i2.p2 TRINITY_DN4082_c1_g1~~TRINITY_DN4082_c1_g1_i2.p2  ORF type:complete len:125 (-),score=19.32 TRINITY_DN4082_c1_g1_i2:2-376(-)
MDAAGQGHASPVLSVRFSGDGKTLESGSHDKTVRVWDLGTGQCEKVLEGVTAHILADGGASFSSATQSASLQPNKTIAVCFLQQPIYTLWNSAPRTLCLSSLSWADCVGMSAQQSALLDQRTQS